MKHDPPAAWAATYAAMAKEDDLPWSTLNEVTEAARAFLGPVLDGTGRTTWDPDTWLWR